MLWTVKFPHLFIISDFKNHPHLHSQIFVSRYWQCFFLIDVSLFLYVYILVLLLIYFMMCLYAALFLLVVLVILIQLKSCK